MNPATKYQRITNEAKIQLIRRVVVGESVAKICREASISRTIFYRWLKVYNSSRHEDKLKAFKTKSRKKDNLQKLKVEKDREIIAMWLDNPEYSIRKIAHYFKISIGSAWKIINIYKKQAGLANNNSLKRYKRKHYKSFSDRDKIVIVNQIHEGRSISSVAKKEGISRTILYKWKYQYELNVSNEAVFKSNRPKGIKHWRFMPEVEGLAVRIATKNPSLSLSKIAVEISNEGYSISRSGLFYVLKRLQLNTYEDRLAYVAVSDKATGSGYVYQTERWPVNFNFVYAVAQFGVYLLFGLMLTLFSSRFIENNYKFVIDDKLYESRIEKSVPTFPPRSSGLVLGSTKQDFKWGALAINSASRGFEDDAGSQLGFGIVDHAGNTICNAQIELNIAQNSGRPSGVDLPAKVRSSGECGLQTVTNTPDYIATIPAGVAESGYELQVKVTTYTGTKYFNKTIVSSKDNDIQIERTSFPTRIFPEASYPVELTIKSSKNISGTLEDRLPKGIAASLISSKGILYREDASHNKIIRWKLNLEKNKVYKLSYSLHFPQIWPEYYEIGPLSLIDQKTGKAVVREEQFWQVVADAL